MFTIVLVCRNICDFLDIQVILKCPYIQGQKKFIHALSVKLIVDKNIIGEPKMLYSFRYTVSYLFFATTILAALSLSFEKNGSLFAFSSKCENYQKSDEAKKLYSDNFTRGNREKSSLAIAILENLQIFVAIQKHQYHFH